MYELSFTLVKSEPFYIVQTRKAALMTQRGSNLIANQKWCFRIASHIRLERFRAPLAGATP